MVKTILSDNGTKSLILSVQYNLLISKNQWNHAFGLCGEQGYGYSLRAYV